MEDYHYIQVLIIVELAYTESSTFSELLSSLNCSSELLAYHLRVLNNKNIVQHTEQKYSLTDKGVGVVSNSPLGTSGLFKPNLLSYICIVHDKSVDKYLAIERKKVPQAGIVTFVAGKGITGESSQQSLQRILQDEVKIKGLKFQFRFVFKQRLFDPEDKLIKDNSFLVFYCSNFEGLGHQTMIARPIWVSLAELGGIENKAYDVTDIVDNLNQDNPVQLLEKDYTIQDY